MVYIMGVEEIRQNIKELCLQINEFDEKNKPIITIPGGATGSAAGLPFEDWFRGILSKNTKDGVLGKLEFVKYIMENYLCKTNLESLLKDTWWGKLQQFTHETIRRVEEREEPKLQQALGDIIVKYGDDLNDVVLINVKATEINDNGPIGRPPNIVSAFRLLEFLTELFDEKINLIDKVNVWLAGFYYIPIGSGKVRIEQSHYRDMFKLDLEKAPPINFDAAIQIQWHLGDMVEREKQTLDEFAKELGEKYLNEWKSFKKRRDEKMEKIVNKLFSAIERNHAQKKLSDSFTKSS